MRQIILIISIACVLAAGALCGCSNGAAKLTPKQVQDFGHLGEKPPPGYHEKMQKLRAYMIAHHMPGVPPAD